MTIEIVDFPIENGGSFHSFWSAFSWWAWFIDRLETTELSHLFAVKSYYVDPIPSPAEIWSSSVCFCFPMFFQVGPLLAECARPLNRTLSSRTFPMTRSMPCWSFSSERCHRWPGTVTMATYASVCSGGTRVGENQGYCWRAEYMLNSKE